MTNSNNLDNLPLAPGSFGLPLLGESIQFLRDSEFSAKRQQKYGQVFKTHIFGRPTLVVAGGEVNRFIFTQENKYFSNSWPYSTKVLLGPASVSVQQGGIHQKRRKILSQAFQPRALASYITVIENITGKYIDRWEKLNTLTWYPEIKNYTLDVACKLFVGTDAASTTKLGEWYTTWVNGLFTLPINLPWSNFGKALRCRKLLLAEIEKIIRQRQQESDTFEDALGLLMQATDENGEKLSIGELKDQILTLIFAGHETLTSSVASFCQLLAQNPEVLALAREEQQKLGVNTPLTLENLKHMTYLEQTLKEVLRFIPPVGGGFREVIKPCEIQGYQVPQGWSVLFEINRTHQDRSIYQAPEKFDPERFSPQRDESKSQAFSYVPFGGGMRECLGKEFAKLEMKIFAAILLRQYQWELLPNQSLEMANAVTPRAKDGLRVKFQRLPLTLKA